MRAKYERYLTWMLAITLVVSLGTVIGIAVDPPQPAETHTEFYVLGPTGNASGYPTDLSTAETGTVIVGISNHESKQETYQLAVTWNGTETNQRTVSVPDEETRELDVTLTPPEDPGRYKVQFLLYRGELTEDPYRTLKLWVTVHDESETNSLSYT